MSELDQLAAELHAAGWHISLHFTGREWTCELLTGPTKDWPANRPRPRAKAATAMEAVREAIGLKVELDSQPH